MDQNDDFVGSEGRTSLTFSLPQKSGELASALKIFKENKVNLFHIESRPSPDDPDKVEFFVTCDTYTGGLKDAVDELRKNCLSLTVLTRKPEDGKDSSKTSWYPKRIKDLDHTHTEVLSYGCELDADHPGFKDPVYRQRRKELTEIATNYRYGQKIPRVEYTAEEIKTWGVIYKELVKLFPTHACREFNHFFHLLSEQCGYREDNIPQLQDVSDFMKNSSGFTLRPSTGLVSDRSYLAGLAFRVVPATQYIRHSSRPLYTPEPDVCHELIGHAAMFSDPSFAQFSQELGLASLGAPDDYVAKLANLHWFTTEFGICRQGGELKAYGGGLLSSFGELQHSLSDKAKTRPFAPFKTCHEEYLITSFQPVYYVTDSFNDSIVKMRQFFATNPRPFSIRYNPYTQSVEILKNKQQLVNLTRDIKGDLSLLERALDKIKC